MSELKIIERLVDDLVTRVEALEEKSEEIWVPIKDNWAYFISNEGRVKTYYNFYPKIGTDAYGYHRVALNGKTFKLHRLLAEAFIPNPENKPFIDHVDGNPKNNSLENLRWATHSENAHNRKMFRTNASGYRGVSFYKTRNKYKANIRVNGKDKFLGYFDTPEEASAAYEKAAREEFGEFYRPL